MAVTLQTVCDRARRPLNDDAKTRWDDEADLLLYAIGGLQTLRNRRADLFRGHLSDVLEVLELTDPLPIPADYAEALAQYVTAMAHFGEDEAAIRSAAPLFYSLFEKGS